MLSIQYSFFTKAVCDLFMSMCTLSNNADMLKFDDEISESDTISQRLSYLHNNDVMQRDETCPTHMQLFTSMMHLVVFYVIDCTLFFSIECKNSYICQHLLQRWC